MPLIVGRGSRGGQGDGVFLWRRSSQEKSQRYCPRKRKSKDLK